MTSIPFLQTCSIALSCFAGEALRKPLANQLTAWHAELKTLVHEARLGELDVYSTPPAEQNVKLNSTLLEVPLRVSLRIGKLGDRIMFVVLSILEPRSLAALGIVSKRMAARVRRACRGERCRGSSAGGERED